MSRKRSDGIWRQMPSEVLSAQPEGIGKGGGFRSPRSAVSDTEFKQRIKT
ncbi:hypothetical protein [Neisseria lactamica]|nr:hypothetical protein [Neisseria lactamica]